MSNLITEDEAAEILRLTPRRLTRMARNGDIPAVILPTGEIRFDQAELLAWVESLKRPATVEAAQ
jgi:excisionase family DNA binding protein